MGKKGQKVKQDQERGQGINQDIGEWKNDSKRYKEMRKNKVNKRKKGEEKEKKRYEYEKKGQERNR